MSKLWKKAKDQKGKTQLQEVDLSSLQITSPAVVFLPGYLVIDKNEPFIRSSLHYMENLVKPAAEEGYIKPQVYSWSFSRLRDCFEIVRHRLHPQSSFNRDAEQLSQNLIMPLVSRNGMPLSAQEARQNLRNLTLVAHSLGTVLGQEIFNASVRDMQAIGYNKDEAQNLLQEVVLIAMGNIHPMRESEKRFTTLYITATNDITLRWKNPFRDIFKNRAQRLTFRFLSQSSLFITAAFTKRINRRGHAVKETGIAQALHRVFIPILSDHHGLQNYVTCDNDISPFAQLVRHAAINAVHRTKTLQPLELLKTTGLSQEEHAYESRISNALFGQLARTHKTSSIII